MLSPLVRSPALYGRDTDAAIAVLGFVSRKNFVRIPYRFRVARKNRMVHRSPRMRLRPSCERNVFFEHRERKGIRRGVHSKRSRRREKTSYSFVAFQGSFVRREGSWKEYVTRELHGQGSLNKIRQRCARMLHKIITPERFKHLLGLFLRVP